jgi:hypothetical protein
VPQKHFVSRFKNEVGRADSVKAANGNESLHEISNDNEFRVVNFATLKKCSHIAAFINTLGLHLMGKHYQVDHVFI